MRAALILAGVLSVCGPALAEQWVRVDGAYQAAEGVDVDADSVVKTKSLLKAWVRRTYDADRVVQLKPYIGYRMDIGLEVINCAERTSATKQILIYQSADSPRPSNVVTTEDADLKFADVLPGSNGEKVLKFVCKFSAHL